MWVCLVAMVCKHCNSKVPRPGGKVNIIRTVNSQLNGIDDFTRVFFSRQISLLICTSIGSLFAPKDLDLFSLHLVYT